ncbi:co-chaperone GroES [bacterium]|nr:co-chaperone GroES [bacterium]
MAKAAAKFGYTPAPGRLIVDPLEEKERTDSGLYLPESAQERPQLGKVMAYVPSRGDDGKPNEPVVSVGETIFHSKYGGTEVKIGGGDFLILREEDVLAIQN